MNAQELLELDIWICKHVMGYTQTHEPDGRTPGPIPQFWIQQTGRVCVSRPYATAQGYAHMWSSWAPTCDPAQAMAVLKKCLEKISQLSIYRGGSDESTCGSVGGETLELAICLFAKALFS